MTTKPCKDGEHIKALQLTAITETWKWHQKGWGVPATGTTGAGRIQVRDTGNGTGKCRAGASLGTCPLPPCISGPKTNLGQNVSRVGASTAWPGKQEQTGCLDGFGDWGFLEGGVQFGSNGFYFLLYIQNFPWKQRIVKLSLSLQLLAESWYALQCPADAGGCSHKFVPVLVCPKVSFDTKSGCRYRHSKVECVGVFSRGVGAVRCYNKEQQPHCPEEGSGA